MKKAILFFCFIFTTTISFSQEVVWHTDAVKAVEISVKSKKPVLLFFTGSDWCGWCIRLQKEVFSQPEFKKWANDNVILLELDFPRKKELPQNLQLQNDQIQKIFNVRGYPTVWLANVESSDGKINFKALGSTGYVKGGAEPWLASAKVILEKK